ncbi:MAG: hypothetical protein ACOC44_17580 [Promethearchaeia archaeon]
MNKKNKQVLCIKCKHNLENQSCASCIESTKHVVENLTLDKGESYKYSCKVLMNNPEEFEEIDPYECKYFLNKSLGFI